MNLKCLHTLILLVLLSLTVHEVHAAVTHDIEVCEICIHPQSDDDLISATPAQYEVINLACRIKAQPTAHYIPAKFRQLTDFIRGPPAHS